jgi:fatty acid desaturase
MQERIFHRRHVDRASLIRLDRQSDARGLARLAGHGAALAGSGWLVLATADGPILIPAMVFFGAFLVFLFAPLHETVHRTAFRSRFLNDAVAWVAGAILVLPPEYFRRFHFAHHRYTQDPARDPELATPKPASLAAWAWHVSGLPYWIAEIRLISRHAAGRVTEPFVPAHARARVIREARILYTVYSAVALAAVSAGSALPLLLWIGPALLGQPLLRLYLLAEHTGCAETPDMLENSRTTQTNALLRYFAWNMPYHAEHHAYPSVPFHALPALHAKLENALGCRGESYLAVERAILGRIRAGSVGVAG